MDQAADTKTVGELAEAKKWPGKRTDLCDGTAEQQIFVL
jgi:hypothetical protein